MPSIFTRMLAGEVPAEKIADDGRFACFAEPRPLAAGHLVVLPKAEIDDFFALSDEEAASLWSFARRVAAAQRRAFPCEKIAVLVIGLKVRHAHVHLVPVSGRPGELDFANAREASARELAHTGAAVRAFL